MVYIFVLLCQMLAVAFDVLYVTTIIFIIHQGRWLQLFVQISAVYPLTHMLVPMP